MASIVRRVLLPVLWLAVAACGPSVPPLAHAAASNEELARAVLAALEQRDFETLRSLALGEREFRDHVWPDLPAARPERNLPFSFVWGDLHQKSEAALATLLRTHGGRHYRLERIEFLDGTTQYKTYVVHRKSQLTVRTVDGGEQRLQLFGSVLAKDGRVKVFSYVVD